MHGIALFGAFLHAIQSYSLGDLEHQATSSMGWALLLWCGSLGLYGSMGMKSYIHLSTDIISMVVRTIHL